MHLRASAVITMGYAQHPLPHTPTASATHRRDSRRHSRPVVVAA